MSATLASLRIRNLALVEDITWEPGRGFVAITGETGAGKSVLLGALTLMLGDRADRSLIRSGAENCSIEAVFENAEDPSLGRILDDNGTDPCEEGRLLVRRVISTSGTGKQFVNGSACTLALLRQLGERLVDLHGPHEHQSLFSQDQQTKLLDAYAGTSELQAEFATARKKLLDLEAERKAILEGEQSAAREIDLLSFQVSEIDEAALTPGEEEDLLARQQSATNAARITRLCGELSAHIDGDQGALQAEVTDSLRLTRELERLDPKAAKVAEAAEGLSVCLSDLATALDTYATNFESDPAALPEIEARLDVLQALKRKYGHTLDEIMAFREDSAARLAKLQARAARSDAIDSEVASAQEALMKIGGKLTTQRKSAAKDLGKKVAEGLRDLGFAKAGFSIALKTLPSPVVLGYEVAEFLFAPNPGEPEQALRDIASSGEISRVMLALKGALAEQDDVGVLVFDEIDANVGGEIATRVASRMATLGKSRQVLCITHLPQVAAAAASQFVVSKEVADGRTRTLLAETTGADRVKEIARMLGGASESALAHAQALLKPLKKTK